MANFEMVWDQAQLQEAMVDVIQGSADLIRELANITVESAKESPPSPYLTGTNRKSITADFTDGSRTETIGDSPSAGGDEGMPIGNDIGFRVYTQSGYGGWLEIGTSKMAARPYIAPGFQKAVSEIERRLEGMLG